VSLKMNVLVLITEEPLCPMKFYSEPDKNGLNTIYNLSSLIYIFPYSQCRNGGWICSEHSFTSRTCSVVGLTHLETFDGSLLTVKPGNYLLVRVSKKKNLFFQQILRQRNTKSFSNSYLFEFSKIKSSIRYFV
jgi:hypothetical protein